LQDADDQHRGRENGEDPEIGGIGRKDVDLKPPHPAEKLKDSMPDTHGAPPGKSQRPTDRKLLSAKYYTKQSPEKQSKSLSAQHPADIHRIINKISEFFLKSGLLF
jgi:hypothetical protein